MFVSIRACEETFLMNDKIRVLLVDDHALVLRGLRRLLEDDREIEVVGEAGDGATAVQLACQLLPTVVMMDCALPEINGLVATSQIAANCPKTAVIMLSMHSEETWVRKAFQAGARGYILKTAGELDLANAVKQVAAGKIVLDRQLERAQHLKGERDYGLTSRELEVLQLIVDGKSNKEIGRDLDLSANTVAVHRANMMQALGMHKTAELVTYAIRNGLVDPI